MTILFAALEIIYPVYFVTLFSVLVVSVGVYKKAVIQILPTLLWAVFMEIPFLFQAISFYQESAILQSYGICIMGLAINLGDLYGLRCSNQKLLIIRSEILEKIFLAISLICIAYFPIYHLLSVEKIPLISKILDLNTSFDIAIERENYAKLLDVSIYYKYAFQWVPTVFGPIAIGILALQKRYRLIFATYVWVGFYSVLSTAKLPILLFLIFSIFAILFQVPERLIRFGRKAVVLLLIIFVFLGVKRIDDIAYWYANQAVTNENVIRYKSTFGADPTRQLSYADAERVVETEHIKTFGRKFDALIYRVFLGPSDVANHWYTYYGFVSENLRPISDIYKKNIKHAANNVGTWAYFERFPEKYLKSISAYASIDADAYSFAGFLGVIFVGLFYFSIRILVVLIQRFALGFIFAPIMIGFLAIFPFQASIQAMLIAQGMILLIVGQLIIKLVHGKSL